MIVDIKISKSIYITGLPAKHLAFIKKIMTIPNPDYDKLIRMGVSPYIVAKDFKFYTMPKTVLNTIIIPRGMRKKFLAWIEKTGLEYSVTEKFVEIQRKDKLKGNVILRDYQEPVVKSAIVAGEGLLHMSTGSGKTICAIDIIKKLGLTATILVPNNVLLSQFEEELWNHYQYKPGIINGKTKVIKDITISTFQSLSNNPELLFQLAANTSILIMDEAQNCPSKERKKVLEAFSPKHLYGLSGSPFRDDGLGPAIWYMFGQVCAKHEMTILDPVIHVQATGDNVVINVDDYHVMIESMVENKSRNTLIAGMVMLEVLAGRKVLVLTKRREHYKRIREVLPEGMDGFHFIDSDDKGRNELLLRLKRGEEDFRAIFGTTSLLAVGTDIPSLDTLIITCDMKGSVLTTQSIGRVLRLFEGKPQPKIIDLWDDKNPILSKQFKHRLALYREKKWDVQRLPDWQEKMIMKQ